MIPPSSVIPLVQSFIGTASSALAMGAGVLIYAMSPEQIMGWIGLGTGAGLALVNAGLAIYHKVNEARRKEYKEWSKLRIKKQSDDDHPTVNHRRPRKPS